MKTVGIRNKTTGEIILNHVHVADTFAGRFRGLIGRKSLKQGEGLLIRPCSSVHSFHMRFSFDAAFINSSNKVVFIIHSMPPWKVSPVVRNSEYVIEALGSSLNTNLKVDDEVEII